jgi:ubiquinone/menaquinone biosynthesis C-methylase UbiE
VLDFVFHCTKPKDLNFPKGDFMRMVRQLVEQSLPDSKVYAAVREKVQRGRPAAPPAAPAAHRVTNRALDLQTVLKPLRSQPVATYLDVGCAEGSLTESIATALGVPPGGAHGCDVRQVVSTSGFQFALLKEGDPKLPYDSGKFDLVTALMSLHHIPHVAETLQELKRVLKPDGVLVIREHDARESHWQLRLDIMHAFYAVVWPREKEMDDFRTHYSHYRPLERWRELAQQAGFHHLPVLPSMSRPNDNPFRYYYDAFSGSQPAKVTPSQAEKGASEAEKGASQSRKRDNTAFTLANQPDKSAMADDERMRKRALRFREVPAPSQAVSEATKPSGEGGAAGPAQGVPGAVDSDSGKQ